MSLIPADPQDFKVTDKKKQILYKWGIVLIIALFSIFILYLNYLMPLVLGDDFLYKLKFPKEGFIGTATINTLGDYFDSQVNHYVNYNNRIAPHALLQLVFLFSPWIFDIINSLLFLLLPWLLIKPFINSIENSNNLNRLTLYLIVLLLIWCFHYDLGRVYFWTTGALNYTWFLVPQIIFTGRLYECYANGKHLNWSDMFLAAVVSTSNENVVLSLFIITLLLIIVYKKEERRIDYYLIGSNIILLLGGVIMLLSPALHLKLQTENIGFTSINDRILEYIMRATYYFVVSLPLLFLFIFYKYKRHRESTFFIILMLVATASMAIPPLYEPRSSIFVFMLFLMFIISQVESMSLKRYWPMILLLLLSSFLFLNRFKEFKAYNFKYSENIAKIEKSKTDSPVVVSTFCPTQYSSALACDDVSSDKMSLESQIASQYFGIDGLVLNTFYEDSLKQDFKYNCDTHLYSNGNAESIAQDIQGNAIINKLEGTHNQLILTYNQSDVSQGDFYILRGSQKNSVKHGLLSILPYKLRLYFLDYMEQDPSHVMVCGKTLVSYDYIDNLMDYDYVIWSLYSKENHRAYGEIIKIDLE